MMKKLLTFLVAIAFVSVTAATSVQAYDEMNHVYQAPNGVGDALIFPLYFAAGDYKTNIRVINTSDEFSIVAKVVFREGISSCETRDFFIYMSPNDMWTADIIDKNGEVTIVSNDDSSPTLEPFEIGMATSCNGYPPNLGYIEVYGVYAFADFEDEDGDDLKKPIDKQIILDAYDEAQNTLYGIGCTGSMGLNFESEEDDYSVDLYRSQNVLAGVEEVTNPSCGVVLPMVATALANNCNPLKLDVLEETRWDSYGYNSAFEVRSALSKQNIHIPFRTDSNNYTFVALNFPVKLSCCKSGTDDCDGSISECEGSPKEGDECLNYDSSIGNDGDCLHIREFQTTWSYFPYDLEEHTPKSLDPVFSPVPPSASRPPMRNEVMLFDLNDYQGIDITSTYAEGWVRLALTDYIGQRFGPTEYGNDNPVPGHNIWYNGSAVIPTYLQFGADFTWVPATYDCADVVTTLDATVDSDSKVGPTPEWNFENCCYQSISFDACGFHWVE